MSASCYFCDLLKASQDDPTFIAEFENSVAFLNFDQSGYAGQSVLILKQHHEHMHLIPVPLQQAVIPELARLTAAILKALGGFRANHQSLGNQMAHMHWHIVPRYQGDRNAGAAPLHLPFEKWPDDAYRQRAAHIRAALL